MRIWMWLLMETVLRGPAAEATKTSRAMRVINDEARGPITGPTEGRPTPGWQPEQEMAASLCSKRRGHCKHSGWR